MNNVLLALGSNATSLKGDLRETLKMAVAAIAADVGPIRAASRFYRTPAFPRGAEPDYLNAAVKLVSDEPPRAILDQLHAIEAEFGRVRRKRWEARPLDIDLLACGDIVLPGAATYRVWADLPLDQAAKKSPDELILPHPRLQERAFVLVPMADVAPDWVHPVTGRTVRQMLDDIPTAERAAIRAV